MALSTKSFRGIKMKKISAHVNITNPETMGFPYLESIQSFANACDEVIVVDGGSTDGSLGKIKKISKVKIVKGVEWPRDFDWTVMVRNLQIGFENCTGDWAFHFDADYIFHEDYIDELRKAVEETHLPAIELKKMNFVLVNECFRKICLPLLVYKSSYPGLRYGIAKSFKGKESATFLKAIAVTGKRPDGIYTGMAVERANCRLHYTEIPVYCYDFTFMTEKQIREQRERFSDAKSKFGGEERVPKERVFEGFLWQMRKRHKQCRASGKVGLKLEEHSKFIRDKVRNIKPDQFGYSGWGMLEQ